METGERGGERERGGGFLRGAKLVDCNVPGFHQVTAQLGSKRRRREGDAFIRELKHLLLLSVKPRAKVNDPRRKDSVLLALECKSQRFAEFALRPPSVPSGVQRDLGQFVRRLYAGFRTAVAWNSRAWMN